ncbi:MAG: type II secretion system protein GspN [Desulfobulbus propionicus]|nr:MAG: type II secretion system protein GspN [Desulfobulbus propionicus]
MIRKRDSNTTGYQFWSLFLQLGGYLVFSFVVLVGLLWLLFPGEQIRDWLNARLNAEVTSAEIRIQGVGLVFPPAFALKPIQINLKQQDGAIPLRLDYVVLRPRLLPWLQGGRPVFDVTGRGVQGMFRVVATLVNDNQVEIKDGTVEGIQLRDPGLRQYLGRTMAGSVSGEFSGVLAAAGGHSQVMVSLHMGQGKIGLQQPVFGLDALAIERADLQMLVGGEGVRITAGKMDSSLLSSNFAGEMYWSVTGKGNQLSIAGQISPHSTFFVQLGDDPLAEVLKKALNKGQLPFTISGTIQKPGISFGDLDNVLSSSSLPGRR